MRRVKQILGVLVLLLIVDCGYLVYKYSEYRNTKYTFTTDLKHTHGSPSYDRRKLDDLVSNDVIATPNQAKTILDPSKLKTVISYTEQTPSAYKGVLFLKTHKTGSSTIQNIILRYAILHNLTIALPSYKASFFWPHKFNAEIFVRKQAGISKYQVLAHHAVFDEREMHKIMVPDTAFITILREPASLFRSAYQYYNLDTYCFGMPIERFRSSEAYETLRFGKCPRTKMPVRSLQAHDLGLSASDMENEKKIQNLISKIDNSMTLVMITELFDESLILLKKKLNWTTKDIIYFKQNAMQHLTKQKHYTDAENEDILEFNRADHLLYKHFHDKLQRELKNEFSDEELQEELRELQTMHAMYYDLCIEQVANSTYFIAGHGEHQVFRPYGQHTLGYVLKHESLANMECRLLALPELALTHFLKSIAVHGYPT